MCGMTLNSRFWYHALVFGFLTPRNFPRGQKLNALENEILPFLFIFHVIYYFHSCKGKPSVDILRVNLFVGNNFLGMCMYYFQWRNQHFFLWREPIYSKISLTQDYLECLCSSWLDMLLCISFCGIFSSIIFFLSFFPQEPSWSTMELSSYIPWDTIALVSSWVWSMF